MELSQVSMIRKSYVYGVQVR